MTVSQPALSRLTGEKEDLSELSTSCHGTGWTQSWLRFLVLQEVDQTEAVLWELWHQPVRGRLMEGELVRSFGLAWREVTNCSPNASQLCSTLEKLNIYRPVGRLLLACD